MINNSNKKTIGLAILITGFLLIGTVLPVVQAESLRDYRGFDKGVSYKPVVPMKKATFVDFDKNTLLDDYAYLSAVPTAVFAEEDKIVSHPLIFYEDKYDYSEDKDRIFNTYDGIEMFMEDWMSYSGTLDQMTLINVDQEEINRDWKANDFVTIKEDNPYSIANKLALQDWSYSDEAVVAVIGEEFENPKNMFEGSLDGTFKAGSKTDKLEFQMEKPTIGVGANYHYFDIADQFKYVVVNMYWKNTAVDLDLQLYDDEGVMADASSKWNILYGAGEDVGSYIYSNDRQWSVGVTYMPTQASSGTDSLFESKEEYLSTIGKMGSANGNLKTMGLFGSDAQDVEVYLYPGFEYVIDDPIPYGCKNAEFTLEWNNPNIDLGFVLLDPEGVETATVPSSGDIIESVIEGTESDKTELTIEVERLGETQGDERYKICVFSLNDVPSDIDFTIDYNWQQNMTREEGDCLASATEGAVLGSVTNSPLLYVEKDKVTDETIDTLYKLGVEKIHLVNIGDYLSNDVKEELRRVCSVKEFTDYQEIYDKIKDITERHDVIFTTVDPWTYYYADYEVPVGEYWGARFVGPAAYIAAHHGAPVLIVDNHPELSQAVVWHTQFWQETANDTFRSHLSSVSIMVQTGNNVVEFLEDCGYELPEKNEKDNFDLETMITVADHFDIGVTWDRTFTGRLIPGRFSASPTDLTYWIARSTFYPALIFENPALKQDTVTLINGSKSKVIPYIGKLLKPLGTDLVIVEEQQEVEYKYPILHTYNVYLYKFNEVGSEHWGGKYATANGYIPYDTPSPYPIDLGAVPDKVGSFYPDIHDTVVTPIYARKAGYSNAFSSNFDAAIKNLDAGVIMWMESCHGSNGNYGGLSFWNPESPYIYEENPWRAYERPMLSPGGIKEAVEYMPHLLEMLGLPGFDALFKLSSKLFIPLNLLTVDYGSTEDPDTTVMNPEFPILLFNDAFRTDFHVKERGLKTLIPIIGNLWRTKGGDGVVIDPSIAGEIHLTGKNGIDFDDNLGNMHCCGLNAVSCLIANTYLHTVFIRHGAPYQILDPWSTSWYSGIWAHSIPRQLALGYTMGQAYEHGMAEVGVEYLIGQYWWDLNENVLFYGDPDIRVWTPDTDWDIQDRNYWEKKDTRALAYEAELDVGGHMPYGATEYPNEKEPQPMIPVWLLIFIVIIVILIIVALIFGRKRKK
jgi:hypothetical protein